MTPIGFLNIDKPAGMTAHDVVARLRRLLKIKQIGHAGTLDPMATGVLPVAVGKACRLIRFIQSDKTYLAEILLGRATTTDDIEGEDLPTPGVEPKQAAIEQALMSFSGALEQVPPAYSAVHYQGRRLYELARAGSLPEAIPARAVTVRSLEIVELAPPTVTVRITCSSGTYIRAIARDLGDMLGSGGCLSALRREQAGPFRIENALTLEQLAAIVQDGSLFPPLIRPEDALDLPTLILDAGQSLAIRRGQQIASPEGVWAGGQAVLALYQSSLIAVCRQSASGSLKPEVVIDSAG